MKSPDDFPSTRWSMVIDAGGGREDPHLALLVEQYWRPIHAYIRSRWVRSDDDADDLTQAFLAWVLESGLIGRAEPSRGRFRGFVKVALERFLIDEDRRLRSQKRGGGRRRVPLDADQTGGEASRPDEILDQHWRAELVRNALRSLDDGYRCEGRSVYFAVFTDYFVTGEPSSYAELAERYDVKPSDVSNMLMHAKRRYREVLRQLVVDTVESPEALADELRWLVERTG